MPNRISEELSWIPGKTGKPGQDTWLPAWVHMTDTGYMMRRLYQEWLPDSVKRMMAESISEDTVQKLCMFLALSHDIGKLTPVFVKKILVLLPEIQNRLQTLGYEISWKTEFPDASSSPHGLAGEAILDSYGCPKWLTAIVGAHHGKPVSEQREFNLDVLMNSAGTARNYYGKNGRESSTRTLWEGIRREWYEFCIRESGLEDPGQIDNPGTHVQMVMTGLLIMADWMASNTSYFPLLARDDNGKNINFFYRAEQAWETAALTPPWRSEYRVAGSSWFLNRFGFEPNAIQQETIRIVDETVQPGILIIEAQMGIGKTEAALAAAEMYAAKTQCGGLFFGLPTQATANGIFPRLVEWAGQQDDEEMLSVRLAHGSADLNETYQSLFHGHATTDEDAEEPLIVHPWFEGNKQALLADFVVGTVDQILLAALRQKHVMLRHLGIAGKTVIIDECHAYDAYMNGYLDRILEWLGKYKAPVIILSATLPAKRRGELVDAYLGKRKGKKEDAWRDSRAYPLLTWTDGEDIRQKAISVETQKKEVSVKKLHEEDICGYLERKLESGGCAGLIVNTVRRAQNLWSLLKQHFPEKRIVLIHAQVTMPDRAEKEKELVACLGKRSTEKERNNLIVIGTQVLEQSLDIDFDVLVTDLCPMDLLLQRTGRLHRHNRVRPDPLKMPECGVLFMDGELECGGTAVYGEWLLERTRELLPETLSIPDDVSELVQETYREPEETELTEEKLRMWNIYRDFTADKTQRAKSFQIKAPRKKGTLAGFLDMGLQGDQQGGAAVRDGEESISVLLAVKYADGKYGVLPWLGEERYAGDRVPDEEACIQIARQRIRLPGAVSGIYWHQTENVIEQLETITRAELGEWQQSKWINGELFLVLDESLSASLCGWKLRYDRELGLTYEKEQADG